jgi:c-di-GMP-binding flagellar brake protein YcgR
MNKISPEKTRIVKRPERRKYLRLTAMGQVNLTVQAQETQVAYLASIGRGGIGVYLHREVRPKQLVVITLKLIGNEYTGEELKIAARVRWASPVGQLYMAGLQFEPMSDQRYNLLLKHLNVMESLQL